jgi:hypothetical protein
MRTQSSWLFAPCRVLTARTLGERAADTNEIVFITLARLEEMLNRRLVSYYAAPP